MIEKQWNLDQFYPIIEEAAYSICKYHPEKGKRALPFSSNKEKLEFNFISCGNRYFDSENRNRLLVIGRASGHFQENEDWVVAYCDETGKKQVNPYAIRASVEAELTNNMYWVQNMDNGERRKTPFFQLMKHVSRELTDGKEEWYQYIAITNLYKFTLSTGGNPSVGLKRAQEKYMPQLLRMQLDVLKPTHILLIVGVDEYDDKQELRPEEWYPEEFRKVIKACNAKIAVVPRPEVRKKGNKDQIKNIIDSALKISVNL